MASLPQFADTIANIIADTANYDSVYEKFNETNTLRDSILANSKNGIEQKVYDIAYPDHNWLSMNIPCKWSTYNMDRFYGYCWFRKSIELPAKALDKSMLLSIGEICCESICFFNGIELERANKNVSVEYIVPSSLIKKGNNQITLRILGRWAVGAFNSNANQLFLKQTITK